MLICLSSLALFSVGTLEKQQVEVNDLQLIPC